MFCFKALPRISAAIRRGNHMMWQICPKYRPQKRTCTRYDRFVIVFVPHLARGNHGGCRWPKMLLTSKCRKGNEIGQLFTFSKLEKSNLLLLNHVDFDDACQPKGGFSASAKYTLRFNKGGFACCVDLSMLMVQI